MFFDVFSSLCASKEKTPNGVAKELGFASSSVTQWKHGSTPRPSALQKIADYFGVSVHYLLGAEQKEKPATENGNRQTEIDFIFSQLSSSRQAKLLELARLYLDDQRKSEEIQ